MKALYLSFLSCLIFVSVVFGQEQWDLVKNKDGIKVYNRKIEGSKLKEFKGTMVLDASVDDVIQVLTDHTQHDKFIYKAKKGSVELLKKSANNQYTYMVIETPWPASNRDIVTHYHTSAPAKDGSITISVVAVNDMKPKQKGIVRVEKMKGYWKITPLGNGKVDIVHQAYSSPGGNVPDAMANSASVDAPFEMLTKLKTLIK